MTIYEAIDILEKHNEWRRGAETEMSAPLILGIAIDLIVEDFKEKNK